MRHFTFALILAAAGNLAAATPAPPAKSCEDTAVSQADMNMCAASRYKQADAQLNAVYQAVLKKHAADAVLVQNLRTAQRAWVAWRDAEMKAMYPDREPGYYGTVYALCWSEQMAQYTQARTRQLQRWLDGTPEGDVCGGSLPVSER